MKSNYLFVLCVILLFSFKNTGQTTKKGTRKNVGVLKFSKEDLTNAQKPKIKYVNSFNLQDDKFLNIHFDLEEPLVKSLQLLAPKLSEAALLEKGNFQFSFAVDGEEVYVENLNTGAGPKTLKTEQQNQAIRLVTPERIDWWGWYLWKRFMLLNGGRDALSEGLHTLRISVRPYLKDDTVKIGELLAQGEIEVEVPKIEIDERLVPVQPIAPNSGWRISKASYDNGRIEALNRKIAEGRYEAINGIVVIKDGQLLIEEYFNGSTRASLHNPRSVGKTIASTVMGIAIAENHIQSENQLLQDFYDLKAYKNYSAKKDSVSLKSLLTMTSGFLGDDSDMDNPGNEEYMYPTDDWVKFGLDQPMHPTRKIGKDYTYFTAGAVILGDLLHKSVPGGLVEYADNKLFEPLGITDYRWQYTPQKVGNTAGGIQLRAIDFAKYGQLYKNGGTWGGKRLLDATWVEKSLAKQVSQAYVGRDGWYYGYLFWNRVYTVNGKDYEVSFCTGNGGNKIFVFKDIPYVIVITASAYGMATAHPNVDSMMVNYILPALLLGK